MGTPAHPLGCMRKPPFLHSQIHPYKRTSQIFSGPGAATDNDDIMTSFFAKKVINIYQNSRSQTAMESVWSVSKLSTESVSSRRELVAKFCVHTADATKHAVSSRRRLGVGGVYWA